MISALCSDWTNSDDERDDSAESRDIKGSKKNKKRSKKDYSGDSGGSCESELAQCRADQGAQRDLYVQMADECIITRENDDPDPSLHHYTLSSSKFDDETYIFSDRPFRDAGKMNTSEFFEGFDSMFTMDDGRFVAPNAAVTFHAVDTDRFEGT